MRRQLQGRSSPVRLVLHGVPIVLGGALSAVPAAPGGPHPALPAGAGRVGGLRGMGSRVRKSIRAARRRASSSPSRRQSRRQHARYAASCATRRFEAAGEAKQRALLPCLPASSAARGTAASMRAPLQHTAWRHAPRCALLLPNFGNAMRTQAAHPEPTCYPAACCCHNPEQLSCSKCKQRQPTCCAVKAKTAHLLRRPAARLPLVVGLLLRIVPGLQLVGRACRRFGLWRRRRGTAGGRVAVNAAAAAAAAARLGACRTSPLLRS